MKNMILYVERDGINDKKCRKAKQERNTRIKKASTKI